MYQPVYTNASANARANLSRHVPVYQRDMAWLAGLSITSIILNFLGGFLFTFSITPTSFAALPLNASQSILLVINLVLSMTILPAPLVVGPPLLPHLTGSQLTSIIHDIQREPALTRRNHMGIAFIFIASALLNLFNTATESFILLQISQLIHDPTYKVASKVFISAFAVQGAASLASLLALYRTTRMQFYYHRMKQLADQISISDIVDADVSRNQQTCFASVRKIFYTPYLALTQNRMQVGAARVGTGFSMTEAQEGLLEAPRNT